MQTGLWFYFSCLRDLSTRFPCPSVYVVWYPSMYVLSTTISVSCIYKPAVQTYLMVCGLLL